MKILATGDSLKLNTGYGRLNRQILGYFASKGHDVIQIAWAHTEPPERISIADETGTTKGIVAIVPPHTADEHAMMSTVNYINGWKPHMLYCSNDYMTSQGLVDNVGKMFKAPFWTQYGVIDGPYCAEMAYERIIRKIDAPVSPSKYGLEQLKKVHDNPLYIPHGVDRSTFKPAPPQAKEFLKKQYGVGDKFVFGSVNRNIWRKQYPALFRAFANLKYVHGLKDIALFVIADPNDVFGNNFMKWATALKLTMSNDPLKPADIMLHRGVINAVITIDDAELNNVYNSFDVLVSASMSEGFGLPTIEAQACGIPIVICDNSANTELTKGHGFLYATAKNIDGSEVYIPPTFKDLTYFYSMPDVYALEMAMLDAYNKSETREKYGKASYEFAKSYDWNVVLPLWDQVLEAAQNFKPSTEELPTKEPGISAAVMAK